ncbi:histidine-containing phosphotransfer protein 1 isoform X1 [Ziziphus jujuba]|uniref:Histidine-containing phosphotransfer protein n=1 Tax=Ziziphus jujuba TaxID=326968 RepID=A0A6P4A4P3_ZIZJJ|nr:histidine-containing phosphotransfer protein 1 isoform X1 [Ziziphus jujuba]
MEVGQMQRQWVDYTKSLFLEGFLDGQFLQLQQLQDESNPDFVVEVVYLFFEDSEKLLNDLTRALHSMLFWLATFECFMKVCCFWGFRFLCIFFPPSYRDQPSVDFKKVDAHVHQFKGSSSSIGASRVRNACIAFRNFCEEQNIEGCLGCLQQVKQEYYLVKNKLETLFRLEQQIVAAGGSIPMTELSF